MNEKKAQTYFKTFHKGYTKSKNKGMTKGDVTERLGSIKAKVFQYSEEFILVRDLKEILGSCGYYLTESQIRRITREGSLKGKKWNELNGGMWYYVKGNIYNWVDYLIEVGAQLLVERRVTKEEKVLDLLIGSRRELIKK